jgi:hypothetical protein
VASNWSISGIGRFFSGRPLNVTLTSDPGNKAVDLSLVRRFRFGAQVIEARAEAFNAFNWFNPGAE